MAKSTSKLISESEVSVSANDIVKSNRRVKEVESQETDNQSVVTTNTSDAIQDVHIEGIKKKKFRINGDNNKILELDTNDIGVSYRLQEAYERLNHLMDKVQKELEPVPEDGEMEDESQYNLIVENLKSIDDAMRKEIDYIFDAPVSEVCADGGSMYAPSNGMFRYEHIIDAITELYETSLNHEFTVLRQRVANRVDGYVKKPRKATKKYSH